MPERHAADEEADDTASKKQCFTIDPIVTVIVGKEKVQHSVHESILCKCPFFDKCLNSGMREQQEKTVNLPEGCLDAFNVFVTWLYHEKLTEDLTWRQVVPAYSLARKFGTEKLQNVLVDLLRFQMKNWQVDPGWAIWAWKNTLDDSPLRTTVLDVFHYSIRKYPDKYKLDKSNSEVDFALHMERLVEEKELAMAVMWRLARGAGIELKDPRESMKCVYHVHENGEKCKGSKVKERKSR